MAKPLVSTYSHKQEPRLVAASFRVKYRDIFSMKNLYKFIHEWILDKDWKDPKQHETFYGQKTEKGASEYWIWWDVSKDSSKYIKYKLRIKFHIIGMASTEIMHEGKKFKAEKGEVEMTFLSWVELSEGEWKKHWLLKHFPDMYKNRIFHTNLEDHKRLLYREIYQLQGLVKKYLNMKGFLPELKLEPFHPSYSWH